MSMVLHTSSTTQSPVVPAETSRLGRVMVSIMLLAALGLAAIGVTQKPAAATPARASHPTQLLASTTSAPTNPCYGVLSGC